MGNVLALRREVSALLAYVPSAFPHYTDHTVRHSDEIVRQLSLLLFSDRDRQPVLQLSAVDAYVLVSAALLHDVGMTVSDVEKERLLTSDDWLIFVHEHEDRATQWTSVLDARSRAATVPPESAEALRLYFAADLETKYLVAEYFRGRHSERSAQLIMSTRILSARAGMSDPVLTRIISAVCRGHGLSRAALDDQTSYPLTEDVDFGRVHTRLVTLLLRVGDLLDLSNQRACQLASALVVDSLPASSQAHWSQFRRIESRSTRPDEIRLSAVCQTADEHRLLLDWFQALEDEVAAAPALLTGPGTLAWTPPRARLHGTSPTLRVAAAPDAGYVPSEWRLQLDAGAVIDLLSKDLYRDPTVFIRELLQNGFDSSRCQLYEELPTRSRPMFPHQASRALRDKLLVRVSLTADVDTGQQVLTIEDNGIGMDSAVIERFLLQVGRSYYGTIEFRRRYGFVPTSRFGVGFLSVFAVADLVEIDTYKPSSPNAEPIYLKLTGPRNYLIREPGLRPTHGTQIRVHLRSALQAGTVTDLVASWCRRVEFPIHIDDLGAKTWIHAETPSDERVSDQANPGGEIALRAFTLPTTMRRCSASCTSSSGEMALGRCRGRMVGGFAIAISMSSRTLPCRTYQIRSCAFTGLPFIVHFRH